MDWLDFECMIADWAENDERKDSKSLEFFADHLHQHIEIALMDYALDNDIDDYEPSY